MNRYILTHPQYPLSAFTAASVPLLDAHLNRHFLPRPNRYSAEMEMGLALLVAPLVAWASSKVPRSIRLAVTVYVLCAAVEQIALLRQFSQEATRPVDMTGRIEYRIAQRVDGNLPGQRVMVPGSIAQWFNAFSDTPQLSGASFPIFPNWTVPPGGPTAQGSPEDQSLPARRLEDGNRSQKRLAGRASPRLPGSA